LNTKAEFGQTLPSKNQLIFLGVLILLLSLISVSIYIGSSNSTSQDTAIIVRTSTTSTNSLGYNIVAGWAQVGTENINVIPAFGVGRTNLSSVLIVFFFGPNVMDTNPSGVSQALYQCNPSGSCDQIPLTVSQYNSTSYQLLTATPVNVNDTLLVYRLSIFGYGQISPAASYTVGMISWNATNTGSQV